MVSIASHSLAVSSAAFSATNSSAKPLNSLAKQSNSRLHSLQLPLSAASTQRRLVAVKAQHQDEPGLFEKIKNTTSEHLKSLKDDLCEIKDQEVSQLQNALDELQSWKADVEDTAQSSAPTFLKASEEKRTRAANELEIAFVEALQTLAQDREMPLHVLVLDGDSPLLGVAHDFEGKVKVIDDLHGEQAPDVVVVDGLLHQSLKEISQTLNQTKTLLAAHGVALVLNQVNPDKIENDVGRYALNVAKKQLTPQLGVAVARALELNGFKIESNKNVSSVNTIVARKQDGPAAQLMTELTSKALYYGVSIPLFGFPNKRS